MELVSWKVVVSWRHIVGGVGAAGGNIWADGVGSIVKVDERVCSTNCNNIKRQNKLDLYRTTMVSGFIAEYSVTIKCVRFVNINERLRMAWKSSWAAEVATVPSR